MSLSLWGYKFNPEWADKCIPELAYKIIPELAYEIVPELAYKIIPELAYIFIPQFVANTGQHTSTGSVMILSHKNCSAHTLDRQGWQACIHQ